MYIKTITKKDYNEYIITHLHKIKTEVPWKHEKT